MLAKQSYNHSTSQQSQVYDTSVSAQIEILNNLKRGGVPICR